MTGLARPQDSVVTGTVRQPPILSTMCECQNSEPVALHIQSTNVSLEAFLPSTYGAH